MHHLPRHILSRAIIVPLALAALAAIVATQSADAFEVVVVKSADYRPYSEVLRGFRNSCACDAREVKLREDEGREKVLRQSPDVIVAIGTSVFKKVISIKDRPVVYTMVIPSETGLALQPNISGVSMDISPEAYMAAMAEVLPRAKRVGLLYDPRHMSAFVAGATKAADAAGLELIAWQTQNPSEVAALLDKMLDKIDIFWMLPDPTVVTGETVDYLLRLSFERNLPVFSFSKKYVEMGAVAALDVDPYDIGVQAGEIVRGFSADRSGTTRVYARKSQLTINAKVAKKMGLKIRDDILRKVDKIE